MVKFSVISPVKNEEKVIPELIDRVSKIMNSSYGNNWEYILVNDASEDGSGVLVKDISEKNKNIVLVNHKSTRGQTGCFKSGFKHAKGEVIVTIDGDLQLQPEDIPRFIEKIHNGYDVVNAIRENRIHPFWIKLASRIYNTLMLLLFNSPVMDAASNFTAFRSEFVKNLPLRDNDHRYMIPITMRRGARRFGELIVDHKGRKKGKSKYKAFPKYIRGFPEIFVAWVRINLGVYDK